MSRIKKLFKEKEREVLSVYFTAGFPALGSTMDILSALQNSGADIVELGMPFSDPLADGPVIQHSSEIALKNGMNMDVLFEQTKNMRENITMPVVLMGYLNPVLQYGMERFLKRAAENGFDALIIPDLPIREYGMEYQPLFEKHDIKNIFLVTPNTSEERVRKIDFLSDAFIYLVASNSTTGIQDNISAGQEEYFKRIAGYKLANPILAGFGISNSLAFERACVHTNGAIIGSAFIKALEKEENIENKVSHFVNEIRSAEKVK